MGDAAYRIQKGAKRVFGNEKKRADIDTKKRRKKRMAVRNLLACICVCVPG